MNLYEILIPTADNQGKRFSSEHNKVWNEFVCDLVGGMTVMDSVLGIWRDSGKEYDEVMTPVRIACTEEQLDLIIDYTLKHYDQIAVFACKVSDEVIIRYAN